MNDYFAIIGYIASFAIIIHYISKFLKRKRQKANPASRTIGDDIYRYEDVKEPERAITNAAMEQIDYTALSEIHIRKLTYLFRLLDFNHNGILQEDDFIHIAENMIIVKAEILGDKDSDSIRKLMERAWINLSSSGLGPR